jgi:ribosome-associated protein
MIRVNERIAIGDDEFDEAFIRASGPGGQHVNKVATAVQLRFPIRASSLPAAVKTRLERLAAGRITADGVLRIEAREHRTQRRNREAARERLAALVRAAARRPKTRRPTRPTVASRTRRLESKERRGRLKKARRRPSRDD